MEGVGAVSSLLRTLDKASRPGCQACPRRDRQYVPPTIVPGAPVLLLAEAPGEVESQRGEVLVGPSGRLLDGLLAKAGLDREGVSLGNVCACYVPGNPTPTPEEVEACAPIVEEMIRAAGPKVIVALGGPAIGRLVGKRSVKPWQGSVLGTPGRVGIGEKRVLGPPVEQRCQGCKGKGVIRVGRGKAATVQDCAACGGTGKVTAPDLFLSGPRKGEPRPHRVDVVVEQEEGRVVVLTFHPAALLDSGLAEYPLVLAALRRARLLAEGRPLIEFGQEIVPVPQDASMAGIVLQATSGKDVTLDVETDGKEGPLKLVGLAPDEHYAVTFRPSPELHEVLRRALAERERTLVGHNLAFDVKVLEDPGRWRGGGVPVDPTNPIRVGCHLWDTMHAAHFERPDLAEVIKPKALDTVLSRFAEVRWRNYKEAFREGSAPDLIAYNAMDCAGTALLRRLLGQRLEATGRLRHFEGRLMEALPVLIDLEQDGVRVDRALLGEMQERQAGLVKRLQASWDEATGGVNHRSQGKDGALRRYVHGTLGLPIQFTGRGKKRRESLDEAAIERLAEKFPERAPALRTLVDLRHAEKVLSTWLSPELDAAGRQHANYNLSGTEWGRLSGDMQQVPRTAPPCAVEGCGCKGVRRLYLPDEGDWAWVSGDFSQGEFRLWGPLAGDPAVAAVYAEGGHGDIHRWVAERFGLVERMGLKAARDFGKPISHGHFYGRQAAAIAEQIGAPVGEIVAFQEILRAEFRVTERYKAGLVEQVRRRGYLTTPFRRRIYFKVGRDGKVEVNRIYAANPQSTLGEMGVAAAVRAAKAGLKVRLMLHDEVGISARWEGETRTLKEAMEEPFEEIAGGWSCPADVHDGENWAAAKG